MKEWLITPERQLLINEGKEIIKATGTKHVAFIVDGNRRWAEERGLSPIEGHREALKLILDSIGDWIEMGIPVVSFWLFSTENWQRPPELVQSIFRLGGEFAESVRQRAMQHNVRFIHLGRKDRIPADLATTIQTLEEQTSTNNRMDVLACIDYGGRDELMRATNKAIMRGELIETEDEFSQLLDTAGIPDPDVVIRTSGEMRTSGFMIWQAVYSELVFISEYFPDLTLVKFVEVLREFAIRERRFGR